MKIVSLAPGRSYEQVKNGYNADKTEHNSTISGKIKDTGRNLVYPLVNMCGYVLDTATKNHHHIHK